MSSAVLESNMFKSAAFDGIPSEAAEILTDVCPGNLKLLTVSAQQNTERVETFMSSGHLRKAPVWLLGAETGTQWKTKLVCLKSLIMYQVNTLSA